MPYKFKQGNLEIMRSLWRAHLHTESAAPTHQLTTCCTDYSTGNPKHNIDTVHFIRIVFFSSTLVYSIDSSYFYSLIFPPSCSTNTIDLWLDSRCIIYQPLIFYYLFYWLINFLHIDHYLDWNWGNMYLQNHCHGFTCGTVSLSFWHMRAKPLKK